MSSALKRIVQNEVLFHTQEYLADMVEQVLMIFLLPTVPSAIPR